jgi:hypothetical protein
MDDWIVFTSETPCTEPAVEGNEPKVDWMGNGRRVSGFWPNTHTHTHTHTAAVSLSLSLSLSAHNPGVATSLQLVSGAFGSFEATRTGSKDCS